MICRHCANSLEHVFLDLGFTPPSNNYLNAEDMSAPELYYPLKLFVCERCWLVQTQDYSRAGDLFRADYAYFSSISKSWLAHAASYARMITDRLQLDENSFVVEIASNDGYLLKNFVAAGIPCLGIEPTDGTAAVSESLGIPTLREFFGEASGKRVAVACRQADLIIGNNVYAHVPDINDFTSGLNALLKPGGTITLEFPHLMQLIAHNQFDTVYHEHYSYLSLYSVVKVFEMCGLRVLDVEEIPTHGGSLRVYGCHTEDARPASLAVSAMLAAEMEKGMRSLDVYEGFQAKANKVKDDLLSFLIEQKNNGKSVAAYGAAAKGNTLLNYAGVKPDLLPYVCDAAPSKQGKFMPGSHIPVLHPCVLAERQPDYVLVLPWNIASEVVMQEAGVKDWGGQFVVAVPQLKQI